MSTRPSDLNHVKEKLAEWLDDVLEEEYYAGFNEAILLAEGLLDAFDSNELAKISVWEFIEAYREGLKAL